MRSTLWTDPFLTIGAWVLAELGNVPDPDSLNEPELDRAAEFLSTFYLRPGFGRLLVSNYTHPNSGFAQSAWNKKPERYAVQREAYAQLVLNAYQARWPTEPILDALGRKKYGDVIIRGQHRFCAYTGEPADLMADKRIIPGWNAKGTINFTAAGNGGIPISGFVSLALHAAPLGCAFLNNSLAGLVSSEQRINRAVVRANLAANLQLAQGDPDAYDQIGTFRTWLIMQMLPVLGMLDYAGHQQRAPAATVLHFNNNNKLPFLNLWRLPSNALTFLTYSQNHEAFQQQVQAAWYSWERPIRKPGAKRQIRTERANALYNDLFNLPDQALLFLNKYIEPRSLPYPDSSLLERYMSLIVRFPRQRLDAILAIADRLTEYLKTTGDKGTYRRLDQPPQNYRSFTTTLTAIGRRVTTSETEGPLFSADEWQIAFDSPEAQPGWAMARSVMMLHLANRLDQEAPAFLQSQVETTASVTLAKQQALKGDR